MPAPKHLSAASKRWFNEIASGFVLESHHLRLLQLAAEAFDRSQEARALLARDGIVVNTENGPKTHPAVAVERDSRLAFARLVREVGLDVQEVATPRPIALPANQRRAS